MSNHCRKKIREEKEAKEREIQEKINLALSRKVSHRKRNKEIDIQDLIYGENDKFPNCHPLSHFNSDYKCKRWRKNKPFANHMKQILLKTFDLEMMDNKDYVEALVEIAHFQEFWIRPLEDWKISTHNRDRQFASLLRWLFVQYDMPTFMDSVWTDKNCEKWQLWYIEIGAGMSAYKVISPRTGLTRKMSHWFMKAPNSLSINQAIRWAQVLGFGGDERMAHAVCNSRLVNLQHNDFWNSLVHLFARTPMMDVAQVGSIIDYVMNEKTENEGYSLKGRTVNSLIAQTEEWHHHLNRTRRIKGTTWEPFDAPDWQMVQGKKSSEESSSQYLGKNQTLYTIKQILSGKELSAEGRCMRHCVYSYTRSCESGNRSIWSFQVDKWNGHGRGLNSLLTIEVMNSSREIVQMRGYCNRKANQQEKNLVAKWAKEAKLTFGNYSY